MHPTTHAWYELNFKLLMREKRGDEFQDFFSLIMSLAHGSDFVRMRPWGRDGDRKNDGYIRSTKELFQVYAPNELEATAAIRKIKEDFAGAILHWDKFIAKWTFVHNSFDGIPPHVLNVLLELETSNPGKQIGHFTPHDLRKVVFGLAAEDIAQVLGPPFIAPSPARITFDEIRIALRHVATMQPEVPGPVDEVDYGKLSANGLNSQTRQLILWGYAAAGRVAEFLNQYTADPELGQRVAATLRAEYLRLRALRTMEPNEIFNELLEFVSAHDRQAPAAPIAVLAHFFQTCDIFEAAHTFSEQP